MNHFETSLKTDDGLELFAQGWEPERAPQAVVCLVHGLGEHSGRYAHLGRHLCQEGFALQAFDLRGHGRSEGLRGHTPSFQAFMKDIDLLLDAVQDRYPGLPRFLYGHSLGGVLVLNYLLRRKPDLAGVVASAPGLRTALEQQTIKVGLAKVMGSMAPRVSLPTGLDPQHICRDPEVVEAYRHDPLVHDRATFRMAKETLEAIQWAFVNAHECHAPLLIMHGKDDPLAYPEGSQEFASRVTGQCTLKLWDGMYHEIHNEQQQHEVFAYLTDWLRSQL